MNEPEIVKQMTFATGVIEVFSRNVHGVRCTVCGWSEEDNVRYPYAAAYEHYEKQHHADTLALLTAALDAKTSS